MRAQQKPVEEWFSCLSIMDTSQPSSLQDRSNIHLPLPSIADTTFNEL